MLRAGDGKFGISTECSVIDQRCMIIGEQPLAQHSTIDIQCAEITSMALGRSKRAPNADQAKKAGSMLNFPSYVYEKPAEIMLRQTFHTYPLSTIQVINSIDNHT